MSELSEDRFHDDDVETFCIWCLCTEFSVCMYMQVHAGPTGGIIVLLPNKSGGLDLTPESVVMVVFALPVCPERVSKCTVHYEGN